MSNNLHENGFWAVARRRDLKPIEVFVVDFANDGDFALCEVPDWETRAWFNFDELELKD
jgi:DNA-directed RNA polymerase delta subunit